MNGQTYRVEFLVLLVMPRNWIVLVLFHAVHFVASLKFPNFQSFVILVHSLCVACVTALWCSWSSHKLWLHHLPQIEFVYCLWNQNPHTKQIAEIADRGMKGGGGRWMPDAVGLESDVWKTRDKKYFWTSEDMTCEICLQYFRVPWTLYWILSARSVHWKSLLEKKVSFVSFRQFLCCCT
jgi:hypothetical protein